MTTYTETLTFIKSKARIVTSDRDTDIGYSINEVYREVVGSDLFDFLRVSTTQVLTAGVQDYALPALFSRMCVESLNVYTTGTTQPWRSVEWVVAPDADLWEGMATGYLPTAARTIPGATPGARKLRVLPNFTATGQTLSYAYYAYPGDISGSTTLGNPDICDAVAWGCLVQDKDWNRDPDPPMQDYERRYHSALRRARSSLLA